jgi:hypothetical protein
MLKSYDTVMGPWTSGLLSYAEWGRVWVRQWHVALGTVSGAALSNGLAGLAPGSDYWARMDHVVGKEKKAWLGRLPRKIGFRPMAI